MPRAMNHPDYVYQPWSLKRRKQASERARVRIAALKAAGKYRKPSGKQKTWTQK